MSSIPCLLVHKYPFEFYKLNTECQRQSKAAAYRDRRFMRKRCRKCSYSRQQFQNLTTHHELAILTIILDDQLSGQHVAVQESASAPQTCKCYILSWDACQLCMLKIDTCNHSIISTHIIILGFSTAPAFTVSNGPLAFTCNSHSDNSPGIYACCLTRRLSVEKMHGEFVML